MRQVTMPHIHNLNLFAQPKVMEHRLLSTLDGPSQAIDLLENISFMKLNPHFSLVSH